jgi:hypothetical protein
MVHFSKRLALFSSLVIQIRSDTHLTYHLDTNRRSKGCCHGHRSSRENENSLDLHGDNNTFGGIWKQEMSAGKLDRCYPERIAAIDDDVLHGKIGELPSPGMSWRMSDRIATHDVRQTYLLCLPDDGERGVPIPRK